jgi:ATP-binding cassette subfamily B protein
MKYIWKIISSTRELWHLYAVIGVFTVLLAVMNMSQPLLTGWAVDEIGKGNQASVSYVVWLAVGVFVLDIASTIFSNIGGYIGDVMAYRLQKLLGERYYAHLLTLPQTFFDTELTGKIIARLDRSVNELSNFMNMMSNNFLQFIFSTIFSLVIIWLYSPVVAILLATLYPIYIWLTSLSSGVWLDYKAKMNKHLDIALGRFTESVGQIKVVKSFNQEKRELKHYRQNLSSLVNFAKPQSVHWHKNDVLRRTVLNVIFLMVYAYVFVRAAQGAFTAGEAVTLILFASQIRIPIFTISFLVDRTQRAIADSKDYFDVLNVEPEVAEVENAKPLKVKESSIHFDAVGFGYEGGKTVLRNISFSISPGQKVALVGESGEGKTTITNLLLGLYKPQEGVIKIGTQNIAEVQLASLRRHIGVVFQDPALFSGTVKENIGYAKPNASIAEIKKAAKAANADGFITGFEKGYDTEIGERGLKLSGGQKQRIAIARAILKDAPILILDEATSSLDSKAEAEVQKALQNLMQNRTTLIIAHRLSTIAHVDQIITLRGGTIDEIGAPMELAKTNGIYGELLALQNPTERNKKKLQQFEITQ